MNRIKIQGGRFDVYVEAILPVTRNQYWYFTTYTGVFFIAPAINKMVESMQENAIKGFCLISILMFSFYGTIAQNLGGDPFGLEEGYSFVWLSVLYMIGAAVKRFQWDQKILRNKNAKRNLVLISIGCVTITTCWYFIVGRVTMMILGEVWGNKILMSYVSPTVLCLSVCLLALFSSMKIGNRVIPLVKFCAPATFGVYLIHMQPLVAKNIISTSFAWIADLPGLFPILFILLVSFAILCICILIDRMRMLIFKVCKIDEIAVQINRKIWDTTDRWCS
ncbi:MAG: acyltransferase family protein [Lachnoclostridium sp.]